MSEISTVGIFCEDIREEKNGQFTVVGIFPDTINVPSTPFLLPKLSVYVRFHVSPIDAPIEHIGARLIMPDGKELVANKLSQEQIATARERARSDGTPLLGFIIRFAAGPLPIEMPGRILAEATINQKPSICGALHINVVTPQAPT